MLYLRSVGTILIFAFACSIQTAHARDDETVRVFIFAGQSNMVGSDSKVKDIDNFGPFVGLGKKSRNSS